jgi:5-methylthioadenosine/S-adenosylhomocysteine deaminase
VRKDEEPEAVRNVTLESWDGEYSEIKRMMLSRLVTGVWSNQIGKGRIMRRQLTAGTALPGVLFSTLFIAACLLILTGSQALAVSIHDVQYTPDVSGNSPYFGQVVTVSGIVTCAFAHGFTIADAPGPWNSVFVYTYSEGPDIGDEVELSGLVDEYYNLTEIKNITGYTLLSTGNSVVPAVIATVDMAQESYEAVLVTFENVTVTSLGSYGEYSVDDGSGATWCDDLNDYMYFPAVSDFLDSMTGVVWFDFGLFKLQPRNTSDISSSLIPHYVLLGDVITMNDTRDIILDAYVEVLGDRIISIGTTAPVGVNVYDTDGLIFPGLIDAHNHPIYNVLDVIPFGTTFTQRSEWQATALYGQFSTQYNGIRDYGGNNVQDDNMTKLAEIRALCAGTTMQQGHNCNGHANDGHAHQGIVINNAERFPSRIYSSTFPLNESQSYWLGMADDYYDRFIVHMSEGISAAALAEFHTWNSWGMLDYRTSVIHGLAFGAPEWALMGAADANLIWSPASNAVLYAATADIPGAVAAGVNVALAPDWTESGRLNILREMKWASTLNDSLWGSVLTAQQLAEFVTCNAADALGIRDRVGQVTVGHQADLAVFPGDPGAPYEALLAADSRDVILTVVSGRPMYGDPDLMTSFPFLSDFDDITIGGQPKKLAIRIDAFAIPESDKSAGDIITELQAAYDATEPKVCEFLALERDVLSAAEDGIVPSLLVSNLEACPNPFNPRANIRFEVGGTRPVDVEIGIFNLRGSLVRTVFDGLVSPGQQSFTWDGLSEAGRTMPAGVYSACVLVGQQRRTIKLVLVK